MTFKLDAYLKRTGLAAEGCAANLETLSRLQAGHVSRIPFENMDPLTGKVPDLSDDALWEKIVAGERGGYCFEHSRLFGAALEAIGFAAKPYLARVRNGAARGGARTHMFFIVTIEGAEYLADCGFGGGAPIYPLKLNETTSQQVRGETFRTRMDAETGEEVLERLTENGWTALYGFDRSPAFLPDIEAANFLCAKWEKAPFPDNLMMAIVTPEGRNTLFNRALKITREGAAEAKRLENFDEFVTAMTGLFRMPVDLELLARVWERIRGK